MAGHGSLEASVFDRGIHTLAVVAVCHFILCYLRCFITLGGCFLLVFCYFGLISPSPSPLLGFWLTCLSQRAYLSPSLLTSESVFYSFPKWGSRYQAPNITLLQASSRAVVFKLVHV